MKLETYTMMILMILGLFLGMWLGTLVSWTNVQYECQTKGAARYASFILIKPIQIKCEKNNDSNTSSKQ